MSLTTFHSTAVKLPWTSVVSSSAPPAPTAILPLFKMRFLALFALVPLTLSSPLLQSRTSCPKPTLFDIAQYGVFEQAADQQGYTPQYGSSISFQFSDTATGVTTSCSRSLPPFAGPIADANNYYNCTNSAVKFKYDGSTLFVKEQFACNK